MWPSFNLLGLTVPEKSVTKNFNVRKLERKKNEEIKGRICRSSLIPVYTIHLPTVHVRPSFNLLGLTVPEKSVTKNFNVWKLARKKNEEIKGQISSSSLILVYTIHLFTVHVCTKFQSSRPHSFWAKWQKFSYERLWNDWMTEWQWQNDGRTRQIQYSPHFFKAGL